MTTTTFTQAPGRELYQRLGFEIKEKRSPSTTEAVVNSVPCKAFQPPFVLVQVAMCIYIAVSSAGRLPLSVVFTCICGTYAMYDLLSGWAHFCWTMRANSLPFGLGDLCRTFQHHLDTTFIYRVNLWTSLSRYVPPPCAPCASEYTASLDVALARSIPPLCGLLWQTPMQMPKFAASVSLRPFDF